ncbi:MSHA biogenesis protein MshP [Litorilituus lipolyticus]|uniref:MSHA biogenesis protein MshP n=1 Tax=Litorilituus lipolyticus TaxID=2491017 RepID=A0A502L279_9GAMM|nr:MSHA biogenesis protein MshP [Litorilituus lipolyticus]TPH17796.1 MSHA biogenesis protein MshP [Litorilituus lipolyticus]
MTQSHSQQGSALMLSLFIIIVLLLLGSALVKVLSTSSETIAQEVIGTRALMAANSGMQAHLQLTFPLNGANACPADDTYDLSGVDGLDHCRAMVNCNLYNTHEMVNYYRLTSTGECGSSAIADQSIGVVRSSRTIQVEARSL